MFRIACILLVCLTANRPVGADQDQTNPDNLAQLRQEVAEVRKLYGEWSASVTRRVWSGKPSELAAGQIETFDWDQKPQEHEIVKWLVSADRFRREKIKPSRMVFLFDGHLARFRDTRTVYNGPLAEVSRHYYFEPVPALPHTMQRWATPDLTWLFGEHLHEHQSDLENSDQEDVSELEPELPNAAPTIDDLSTEELRGHLCWHLIWSDHGDVCEAWLAKDRGLLPIRLTRNSPSIGTYRTEIISFQKTSSEQGEVWMPKQVIDISQAFKWDSGTLMRLDFDLLPPAVDNQVFANEPWMKPSGAGVAGNSAYSQFIVAPPIGKSASMLGGSGRNLSKLAIVAGIVTGVILLFAGLVWLFAKHTRFGRWLGEIVSRRRRFGAAVGVIGMITMAYCTWFVPGWMQQGIALLIAGVFGILWFLVITIMSGRRTFSINAALWLAFCVALVFAGYSGGLKRSQMRQSMADQIRAAGGRVNLGQWDADQTPFYIPEQLNAFLGDAFAGTVNSMLIPQQIFTAANVHSWCVDEAEGILIAPESKEHFAVDANTISAIGASERLRHFWVTGGSLNDEAIDRLKRFPNLTSLRFNCDGKSVPENLVALQGLQILAFENAVINDALLAIVSQLPALEMLVFSNVQAIEPIDDNVTLKLESGLHLHRSEITPRGLQSLGNLPTQLLLVQCNLNWQAIDRIAMPKTTAIHFDCPKLTDQWLSRLQVSEKMESIGIHNANITPAAFESFSQKYPSVVIEIGF